MSSRRTTAVLLALLVAVAAASWFSLDALQRLLIFRPTTVEAEGFKPGIVKYEDVWIPVGESGDRIHAWWVPARGAAVAERAPTLLYLHGASRNLTSSVSRIVALQTMGFNVLAIDYRGFGQSTWRLPSERSARDDALAAWEWLKRRVPEPRRRILYGHSLGGAIATEVALRSRDAGALVLDATFTSVKDMARRSPTFGWLPLDLIVTQELDTLGRIGAITLPVFIVHGSGDTVVPADMARQLYAAAPQPKRLLTTDGLGQLRLELMAIACPGAALRGNC